MPVPVPARLNKEDIMNPYATPSAGTSIFDSLDRVKEQVDYEFFAKPIAGRLIIDKLFDDLCLIIAEVFVTDSASYIKINGNNVETRLVQEVFSKLRHEHLISVFDNFNKISYPVHSKKNYLRTSLYNALFELAADVTNQFRIDFPVQTTRMT